MPELPDSTSDLMHLKIKLEQLRDNAPEAFSALLRRCVEYHSNENFELLKELSSIGLLSYDGAGSFKARYAAYCLSGLWFITDCPQRPERDSVFPLYPESVFFVNQMSIPADAKALDICTGCGIYPAFAARFTKHVTAVDINPRALEFAHFNFRLNGINEKIELLLGDLFQPVAGRTFDYISANPPFEPTPPGAFNYIHSDGGADGLNTVRRLMENIGTYLSGTGRFEMVTFSLGGNKGVQFIDECYPIPGTTGEIDIIYPPVTLDLFSKRFRCESVNNWLTELYNRQFDKLYILFVALNKSNQHGINNTWCIRSFTSNFEHVTDWIDPAI